VGEQPVIQGSNDRPLRVCLVSWAPFLAGAEIAAERLAVGLQEAGHEVLVLLGHEGPTMDRMRAAGLRCVHQRIEFTDKWHWLRYRKARNGLRRRLERERPDVVHSNDLPTHQIVSDAVRGTGIPEVCHHRWVFDGPAIDWLNKFGAAHHLFVSRYLMEELSGRSGRLRGSRRAVVYDGLPLPPPPADADRQSARQHLGLPADRVLVTFAGQVIERKGVADLLHAWSRLDDHSRQRAELLIIGDDLESQGKYRAAMEQLSTQLGCSPRFVGFQKNVGEWLRASDIAVVPSHVEPLGNATLEAMSCGLPVLATVAGGIPEMVVQGETGLLVAPRAPADLAAALARLLADAELRRRLGARGRRRCEEVFSLQAHVRAVLAEYDRVLSADRAGVAS
jgi:glycosyltransferase involved in cell wall biosynthesis